MNFGASKQIDQLTLIEIKELSFKQLGLKIMGSWVEPLIEQLYRELRYHGIKFEPRIWIGEEWFSPDGEPGFAIPFYLLHPKLRKIHYLHTGNTEGTQIDSCLKLLRHETAHALDNAFHLRKLKQRQKLFGLSSKTYPQFYQPNPASKMYVRNIEGFYGQSHPDEDWAETFAVWINPNSQWQHKYANWPAINKLKYLDHVMKNLPKKIKNKCQKIGDLSKSSKSLSSFYQQYRSKRKDQIIKNFEEIASSSRNLSRKTTVHQIIRVQRHQLIKKITQQTRLDSFTIKTILDHLEIKVKDHNIVLPDSTASKIRVEKHIIANTPRYLKKGLSRIYM